MSQNKKPSEKKNKFKAFFTGRSARRGAVSIVITALFIAAIVLLNIVLATIKDRHPMYIDVTENASYQLQQDTKDFLDQVDDNVTIYVLQKESDFENGDSTNYKYRIQANKLIHAMASYSDNVELRYIDLDATPTFTNDYPKVDWSASHASLVVCGDKYREIDLTDMFEFNQEQYYYNNTVQIDSQKVEQAFMTEIMNVTASSNPKVSVLNGQGEQDLSAFTTLLENNAYEVEQVSLLEGSIAKDSDFVIIYEPDVDISEDIYNTLSAWLKNDGKYGHHLMYVPNLREPSTFKNINTLLADYGMEIPYGYIQDAKYAVSNSDPYITWFDYAENTDYTDDLRNPSIPVVMWMTMPILINDETMASPLLLSSDESRIEYQKQDSTEVSEEASALNGAAIGVHNDGTEDGESSSVIVVGSPFALNYYYLSNSSFNNAAYFVNLFNVLTEREDPGIVIEGKDPSAKSLGVTSMKSIEFPAAIVRFVIPIAVLLIGLVIWIRRRHR